MYNSLLALVFRVFKERGEKEATRKKRSISASLDFESKIAMHRPFLRACRTKLKVCSSILCV
jgi:hypothetical protein